MSDTAYPDIATGTMAADSLWQNPVGSLWKFLTAAPNPQPAGGEHTAGLPAGTAFPGAPNGVGYGGGTPVLPNDPRIAAMASPDSRLLDPRPMGDAGSVGAAGPAGATSAPPPLETRAVPPTPTDNPHAPPAQVRPERTTVQGAPPASLFQRLGQGDWNTSRMLLSLAAGFGGAHNLGEGIGRASGNLANAIPGIQQQQMSMAGINLTANYLQSKGLSGNDALAVAINPELAKSILPIVTGSGNKFENGLVVSPDGHVVADFRYMFGMKPVEIESGGEKSTVMQDPYGGLHQAHVEPSRNVVPHQFTTQTEQAQRQLMRSAPEGSRYHEPGSNRVMVKRGGRLVWEDNGQLVEE